MYFVISGEGPSDVGACNVNANECSGDEFVRGPMAVMIDQVVSGQHQYSFLETGHFLFVSEGRINQEAKQQVTLKKSPRLPGLKRKQETAYFYNNARAISRIANNRAAILNEDVVAVLFHDSDGTVSAGRGLWDEKHNSMLRGFSDEQFERGVPMIPKPKSEAWLICALKENPYQNCNALENRSGNDKSPNNLKDELAELLDGRTIGELPQMVTDQEIDIEQIQMPSFLAFKQRLQDVI